MHFPLVIRLIALCYLNRLPVLQIDHGNHSKIKENMEDSRNLILQHKMKIKVLLWLCGKEYAIKN